MENMFVAVFNSLNCKITILTNKIHAFHWYPIDCESAIIKVGNSGDNLAICCKRKRITQKHAYTGWLPFTSARQTGHFTVWRNGTKFDASKFLSGIPKN